MAPRTPTAILLSPTPAMVRAARDAGARSLVLAPDLSAPPVREAVLAADDAIAVDWCNHPRLLAAIGHFSDTPQRIPAPGRRASVFGFDEAGALVAARANEALGLPGNPHAAVAYLTDKAALRDRVNRLAATPVRFERCDRAAGLVPAAERVGFPCVVKPRTGSAGQDVHMLHGAAEAHALARQSAPDAALIVEEYLAGPEFTVEAHSRAGRHTLLAVSRTHTTGAPDCVVTGHDLPARLGGRLHEEIAALVEITLDAAGHRHGPSSTEIIITGRGPALVESHAHPASDRMGELLALATGTDPYALAYTTVLDLPRPAYQSHHRRYAAVRYLPPVAGRTPDPGRLAAVRAVPGVISVEPPVCPPPPDSHAPAASSRVAGHGAITATADSPQDLSRVLREIQDRLRDTALASSKEEELSAV
ncbi:ATP-grasp domain-containing protein [Streptomyces aidingensis]|uniref:ATP-grasp domain-containing protein n=1 Tax=Streptomyces aidingensis TaxID=910347 RepID=A0A1I1RNR0_9ACTN|nr:ATP-grasp domain-containing protein [Streptomyces aidingensis]SFD32100.1 ATP-grasp domain-containing protein [Streptomyces aidingensis]